MALEEQPKQEESSSTLSKVVWGALIAGAAVGAAALSPHVLAGVGNVADWTADKFFTVAQGVSPTGENVHSAIGTKIDDFGDSAKALGEKVSAVFSNAFSNPAAVKGAEGIVDTASQLATNTGSGVSHAATTLWNSPGATATIAGSALAGAGVGLGVKSWAQRVGSKKNEYETQAARIEAERSQQGITGPLMG